MFQEFLSLFQADFYGKVLFYGFTTWPLWLPLVLMTLLFNTWFSYKRRDWIQKQGSVLLEIKLPRNIEKSPVAMEAVLEGMWEPVAGSFTDVFVKGQVRDWFSLEIVSLGGEVKFFIWTLPRWKRIIESRIYAQYPGAEVAEVEDYALGVHYDPSKMRIWGVTTKLNKADAYPIKSYIDYELDKTSKEQEQIVDPIIPVLEYLGSLKPGEQAWIQILIQAHRKEGLAEDAKLFPKPDWKGGIKKEMKKIIEKESLIEPKPDKPLLIPYMTKSQDATMAAIERNAGKLAYDTMMRILYTAPLEVYDGTKGIGLVGSTRQFGTASPNGIRPDKFIPGINYPWEDFRDIRRKRLQRTYLDAFKRRSFFNAPYRRFLGRPYVLSTEELATIFHFPGAVATTPTLSRVPSKKVGAPANLPI